MVVADLLAGFEFLMLLHFLVHLLVLVQVLVYHYHLLAYDPLQLRTM